MQELREVVKAEKAGRAVLRLGGDVAEAAAAAGGDLDAHAAQMLELNRRVRCPPPLPLHHPLASLRT